MGTLSGHGQAAIATEEAQLGNRWSYAHFGNWSHPDSQRRVLDEPSNRVS